MAGDILGSGACMAGGVHGTHAPQQIQSMSGRYASYWNAFLFIVNFGSHVIDVDISSH